MNTRPLLTKEFILSKISEEEIFERYMQIPAKLGTSVTNPLRVDKHPGCRFYMTNGRMKFKDFSKGWCWDCFDAAMKRLGKDFPQTLEQIAIDFRLIDGTMTIVKKVVKTASGPAPILFKGEKKFLLRHMRFTDKALAYWEKYFIDRDLLSKFYVKMVEKAWIMYDDGRKIIVYEKRRRSNDICFSYYLGNDNYQLYFPNRSDERFMHLTTKVAMGHIQLPTSGEFVLITKSYKDVIALKMFGIPSVAPASENIVLPEKYINRLKSRFSDIFTLFDNDLVGKKVTIQYRDSYSTTPLLFPSDLEKDFTDNLLLYGKSNIFDLILGTKRKFGYEIETSIDF